jgi:hypothetical protein
MDTLSIFLKNQTGSPPCTLRSKFEADEKDLESDEALDMVPVRALAAGIWQVFQPGA